MSLIFQKSSEVMPISSNFAQMFPPNKLQPPNTTNHMILRPHEGVVFDRNSTNNSPWIIYVHCHPIIITIIIIQLDRFGKKNMTSGICKSMRIHAVMFVQPMCLESVLKENFLVIISWPPCSCHSFSAPAVFFCVHPTRFNDIAFSCTCQARDWKNHRPPTGYLQVLRIMIQTSIHAWWKPYWRTRTIPL